MKPKITIRLFGKFSVHCGDQELLVHSSSKAKEVFCYLAVSRRGPIPRETLAALISSESSVERARKSLRQALWQLRADLTGEGTSGAERLVHVTDGWAQFTMDEGVWLDIAEFELAAADPEDIVGSPSGVGDAKSIQAIELYRGDFLQGWYQEWCLEERERLRQIYLATLDSLIAHCELRRDVTAGVAYAVRALHTDPARECTHRALMRLYCLAGDRASALRQYERCVEALRHELRIEPDDETRELEREIRTGRSVGAPRPRVGPASRLTGGPTALEGSAEKARLAKRKR
jgi:DNA-binding SARP family transcriptional activator